MVGAKRPAVGKSSSSTNPDRVKGKGHTRDRATINRLNMYTEKAKHDKNGKFVRGPYMSKVTATPNARIAPNRKWFGNTRVIGQKELENFRNELTEKVNDPYRVVLRHAKVPMALLKEPVQVAKSNIRQVESFSSTFGKKAQRKRPKLAAFDYEALNQTVLEKNDSYDPSTDTNLQAEEEFADKKRDHIFEKGQSKRIWGELYKVVDSSDVLIQVLDARDPMGTRSRHIEQMLKLPEKRHKHLILVLNKCDLVPTHVTAKWVRYLSQDYPTLAFHSSLTNPFGKGSLIQLLRQFSKLHSDKKQISVGFIGYPNVGKSSIINTLRSKKVCEVAPVPGETKVWRYITLMRKIFLIDCPGVVYPSDDTEADIVLKGVVRIEMLEYAAQYIPDLLERVKKEHILKLYKLKDYTDHYDLLEQHARSTGKLLKGGEPDYNMSARMMLQDWQRGRLPYYTEPPTDPAVEQENAENADNPDTDDKNTTNDLGVTVDKQFFNKIKVNDFFDAAEHEDDGGMVVTEDEMEGSEVEDDDEMEEEEEEGEGEGEESAGAVLDWDDVFGNMVGDTVDASTFDAITGELSGDDDDEQGTAAAPAPAQPRAKRRAPAAEKSERKKPVRRLNSRAERRGEAEEEKEERMKTNKKVKTNYYTTANVKNKNRSRNVPKKTP
eukprot:GCRY01000424.1.p1 GENE.GCRY01000424.1~~GCRY01000424.1.p1  ORF type:complete len:663 (+),score=175.93 GCRY01000424.1:174-2162(+)